MNFTTLIQINAQFVAIRIFGKGHSDPNDKTDILYLFSSPGESVTKAGNPSELQDPRKQEEKLLLKLISENLRVLKIKNSISEFLPSRYGKPV